MVTLAFYKGAGDWTDKAIRLWTRSKYSHSELVINGVWYSSSPRDLKVRGKIIIPQANHWDYIDIPTSNEQKRIMVDFFNEQMGKPYDFLAIFLTQILPLNIQDPNKWFCSESDSKALMLAGILPSDKPAQWYSPERLFQRALSLGTFRAG